MGRAKMVIEKRTREKKEKNGKEQRLSLSQ